MPGNTSTSPDVGMIRSRSANEMETYKELTEQAPAFRQRSASGQADIRATGPRSQPDAKRPLSSRPKPSIIQRGLHLRAQLVQRLELAGFGFGLQRADRAIELLDLHFLTPAQVLHHRREGIEEVDEFVALA